jgi:hypothetical protein
MRDKEKVKNRTGIQSSNSPSEYLFKGTETRVSKRFMYSHCSVIG